MQQTNLIHGSRGNLKSIPVRGAIGLAAAWLVVAAATSSAIAGQAAAINGDWSLGLPNDEAGWLSIRDHEGTLDVRIMWAVGGVRRVADAKIVDGQLQLTWRRRLANSDKPVSHELQATASGDELRCVLRIGESGEAVTEDVIIGKRLPPLPPRPDLTKVQFGPPQTLFNGRDLTGWQLRNPAKKNGWSVQDGVLANDTPKTDFSAYGEYGNLLTTEEFTDFQLHIEFRVGKDCNSGVYLRGMYEAQVVDRDSPMQGISGPGAIFSRIEPSSNAGRPGGEWQSYDLTLVNRHVTVVLNGTKVIDNQPVIGPTGGALYSDVTRPGPIYLQGDHTSVEYRNIVLRPVIR